VLSLAPPEQKDEALAAMQRAIRANPAAILSANAEDVAEARAAGLTSAFIDRLTLTPVRVEAMAEGIAAVRNIADPVGVVTESWQRPNGMTIERVRVPLGVVAVIFESRPNVAADAGVLCLKSGNAVILRGGSDSFRSCRAIHECLVQGLREAGLPEASITLVPTRDRAAVGMLLSGLNGAVDVIVPRGGKSLVARVEAEARVPVFAHLEGVNHVYVDRNANLDMAKSIVLNAKMRRTGVCGAAETLLVDRAGASSSLKPLIEMLIEAGCEPRKTCGRGRLGRRISRRHHRSARGRRRRWGDRAYPESRLAPHRCDRDRRRFGRAEIPQGSRLCDRASQCLDAICRRRRVRLRRRDRHCHRQIPRPWAGRRRSADELQVPYSRHGADPAVILFWCARSTH
jgi:gamma-glutamyl phosphate reductase